MLSDKIVYLLELLTGQKIPFKEKDISFFNKIFDENEGISFLRLNEILLYFGYNRITIDFYKFIYKLKKKNEPKEAIKFKDTGGADLKAEIPIKEVDSFIIESYYQFKEIVYNFDQVALLSFGNIKYGFKTLNRYNERLEEVIDSIKDAKMSCFTDRKESVITFKPIDPFDTYYLGYIVQGDIDKAYNNNPEDPHWKEEKQKMESLKQVGEHNNNAYLVSEIMDVYIATSMRNKHEFIQINDLCKEVFLNNEKIKKLNLRHFNPTQAYCADRIDKGLTEALMLKRALCMIYLVQESDTLGKNSELASTLAQGKPVIAYLPEVTDEYFEKLIQTLNKLDERGDFNRMILDHLCIFEPSLAWDENNKKLRKWLNNPELADKDELLKIFRETITKVYNKKAENLIRDHPLGIQVNLSTGVANGVLLVRTPEKCAELLYAVLSNDLEFKIEPNEPDLENDTIRLVEKISGCVYRVMTKNQLLSNTFWNFYTSNPLN